MKRLTPWMIAALLGCCAVYQSCARGADAQACELLTEQVQCKCAHNGAHP